MNIYFNLSQLNGYFLSKFVKINLLFSLLTNIAIWLWVGSNSQRFTDLIFLHYNIYFGIDLVAPWYYIFTLPVLGLILLVFNFLVGSLLYETEKLLSYFLAGSVSLIQILLVLASIFIVYINL